MEYATLGHTGLLVSKLCFGTMTFGEGRGLFEMIGAQAQNEADSLVRTSIEAGINFFDTADVYSEGDSEKTLGQSMRNLGIARKDLVIATKVYGRVGMGRNDVGASRGHIMDAVEASLRRLQTDYIDLYQIHGNDSITPVEETLRALDTLVVQGKVRYIGVSNWQAWRIAKALGTPILIHQPSYSLLNRWIEPDVLEACDSNGLGIIAFSPLGQGMLTDRYLGGIPADSRASRNGSLSPDMLTDQALEKIRALDALARGRGQTLAQMALAWTLRDPRVTSTLVGASSVAQLEANVGALARRDFNADELAEIDRHATDSGINIWAGSSDE